MRFIYTIELPPSDYAKEDYLRPIGSILEFPKQWSMYREKCLSDSNLGHIKAVKEGSFLVDINALDQGALFVVIEKELEDIDLDHYEDQLSALKGGLLVIEAEKTLLEPMCCCELNSSKDWLALLESQENTWLQLWIGHPWVFYRKMQGKIEFSDYTDHMHEQGDIRVKWSIEEQELIRILSELNRDLMMFKQKVKNVLSMRNYKEAENIATLMVGI